jgi:hypothetical protein
MKSGQLINSRSSGSSEGSPIMYHIGSARGHNSKEKWATKASSISSSIEKLKQTQN